jgi:GTPase SAR1 family protein
MKISDIHEAAATLPPRVLIHGQEGVGKTTLAAKFPKAVFLQTEDGAPAGLKVATFGLLSNYTDVRDALAALGNEPHDFGTVVLDSADKLEGLTNAIVSLLSFVPAADQCQCLDDWL